MAKSKSSKVTRKATTPKSGTKSPKPAAPKKSAVAKKKSAAPKKAAAAKKTAFPKKIPKVTTSLIPAQIVPGWFRIFQTAVGSNPSSGFYEVGRLNVVSLTGGRTVETYFMHSVTSGALRRYEPTGTYTHGVDRRIDHWRFNMMPAGTGGAPSIPYTVYECTCEAPYAGP